MTVSRTGEPGTSQSGRPQELVPGTRRSRMFPGEERQLAAMRRWLESVLPDCPERHDVAIVATELGSNAIRHTASGQDGWFAVDIVQNQSEVRVMVTDSGSSSQPKVIADPAAESGRGLLVVRGLAARTGISGDHRGHLVWADIPWTETADEPAEPQEPQEAATADSRRQLTPPA